MTHAAVQAMMLQDALPFKATTGGSGSGRIGLLSRRDPTQPVLWFEVDPYVCFHTVNAWEEGDLVHITCCRCAASSPSYMHVVLES